MRQIKLREPEEKLLNYIFTKSKSEKTPYRTRLPPEMMGSPVYLMLARGYIRKIRKYEDNFNSYELTPKGLGYVEQKTLFDW